MSDFLHSTLSINIHREHTTHPACRDDPADRGEHEHPEDAPTRQDQEKHGDAEEREDPTDTQDMEDTEPR